MKKSNTFIRTVLGILAVAGLAKADINIQDEIRTYTSLSSETVYMTGKSELHLTALNSPMSGCVIHLNSPEAWLFLTNIKPSTVNTTAYRNQIRVNGAAAVAGTTIRIVEYVQGTVVIPHSSGYTPLQIYSGFHYTGSSQSLGLYTYYQGSASLGELNKAISSFKLKRGYMAAFAQNTDGTGNSRIYVAQDNDINIPVLPEKLNNACSFVRVFPWRWTSQKGWAGGSTEAAMVNSAWRYDWDNAANSTLDIEYVPMRHNANWNAYSNINSKQNSTHALGFNEPDKSDQANMTVAQAIEQWPNLLASGLRLGSPAPSDAAAGLDWLYSFIDEADARNYRVDYVAVHFYKNNWTASQMYSWLRGIHERTRRPVWVTEWNNGCNWTEPHPSYEYNATKINELVTMMATAPFVERYAIYQACTNRELIIDGVLTPAGTVYRDHISPTAFIQPPVEGAFGCAYYPFNGNMRDSLVYGNDAASIGGHSFAAGYSGQALSLNGSSNYVMLPSNLSDAEDFTFAARVYWNGSSQWQRIFDFGDGTGRYMMLTPRSGGNTLRFDITSTGNSNPQRMETTQLAANTWVHVAVTISGNTGKLFVNGSRVAMNTTMTLNPSDIRTRHAYLGKSQWGSDPFFNGRLDEVHIADYALSETQIAALAGGTLGNAAPAFTADPVVRAAVMYGNPYNETLIYSAGDFDAGTMPTFSKISGPAWLTVTADGTLTGTPTAGDVGENTFTVRVTDSAGAWDEATLNVSVFGLGLRAHYEFENNANDSIGGNHATTVGSPAFTTGKKGQAIDLDGTDDYIALPSGIVNSEDYTIAAWINWDGGNQWQRIFDFGNSTSQYMFLTPRSGGNTLRFAIITSGYSSEQRLETSQPATGEWVHVAVTQSGNVGKLYVNGAPAASNNSMTISPADFYPLFNYIGKSQFPDPLFNGRIDEFRIYNYALSDLDVSAVYQGNTAPIFTAEPIINLDGIELRPYAGHSLATYAYDSDGIDTLTFSKDAGPVWLNVASNGTLSGIPNDSDSGQNIFAVRVTDHGGLYDTAAMTIRVADTYSGLRGLEDLVGFAVYWLAADCGDFPACGGAELTGDNEVDGSDFSILAKNWLAPQELQLHLTFDEISGTTVRDDSIYGRSGLLVNTPTWSSGVSGGALEFNGVDDYVVIPGYKGIAGSAGRTCTAWIKPFSTGGEILSWGPPSSGAKWTIRINENGILRVEVGSGTIYGTTVLTDGNWHHIAVVLEDDGSPDISEAKLYVNGILETTGGAASRPVDTGLTEDVRIGVHYTGLRYFMGLIDEVRIYDKALTEQELQSLL